MYNWPMAKARSIFVCQQCGYESPRWMGKCPNCNSWNSLVETVLVSQKSDIKSQNKSLKVKNLSEISLEKVSRIKTNIEEFDQILGGGIVLGQVILIAGSPGIGKSTLLLQVADSFKDSLYVSGEESANQVAMRANRLGTKNKELKIMENTDIDDTVEFARSSKPGALIIDSIQTMTTSDLSGMAGSVGQVRECAFRLVRFAKENNIPVFIVGHVTKEGSVAGPSVLAHIVDSVLWFEGDKSLTLRMIRVVKNRFGPTDNIGIFEMKEVGLISVSNPEESFLTNDNKIPGRVVSAVMEGVRPVLVEIESLVVPSKLAFPKRIAQGIDAKRFELLIAVMIKHCRLPLYEYDCFVNVAGGIKAHTPSVDLAICLSIASSFFEKSLTINSIVFGEVGLLGEIRSVIGEEKVKKLAKKLGYKNLVTKDEYRTLQQVVHNFLPSSK